MTYEVLQDIDPNNTVNIGGARCLFGCNTKLSLIHAKCPDPLYTIYAAIRAPIDTVITLRKDDDRGRSRKITPADIRYMELTLEEDG